MKKAQVPLAIVLGAIIGASGYFAADKLGKRSGPSEKPATATEMAEVKNALKTIQGQLAKLEVKKPPTGPVAHKPPTAVPPETRPPRVTTPRPPRPGPETWGTIIAKRYRTNYHKEVLGDLRKALKLDEAKWKELQPLFEKHFAPVEAALKEIEAGKGRRPPKINELLRPSIPVTLAKLKKSLSAKTWRAFDAWRKADSKIATWGPGRGDYFLDGENYKDYRVKKGAARSWYLLQRRLSKLYGDYDPGRDKRKRFEAVLKVHLEKALLTVREEKNQNLLAPTVQAKLKALTKTTEAKIGKILGADGLAKFRAWKTAPANPASQYFGEPYRIPGRPMPIRPTPPPVVKPGPREEF